MTERSQRDPFTPLDPQRAAGPVEDTSAAAGDMPSPDEGEDINPGIEAAREAMFGVFDPDEAEMMAALEESQAAASMASPLLSSPANKRQGGEKGGHEPAQLTLQPYPEGDPPLHYFRHRAYGEPTQVWIYRNAKGAPIAVAARYETTKADGSPSKVVLPWSYGRLVFSDHTGRHDGSGWHCKAPPLPRPLYGLDRLAARPAASVLVTEGEKTADAAATLFPDWVAISWQGGAQAVSKADWSLLRDRVVAIWPDADDPGRNAAAAVMKAAQAAGASQATMVSVPFDWPKGWDVADFGDPDRPQPATLTRDALHAMLTMTPSAADRMTPEEALRADVARVAAMPSEEYEIARRDIARSRGMRVTKLDELRKAAKQAIAPQTVAPGVKEAAPDSGGLIPFWIDEANLPETAARLAAVLPELRFLFDRGHPIRLTRDRAQDSFVIEPLTRESVVNVAHRLVQPYKLVRRGDQTEPQNITLPERVAALYLNERENWNLPPLDGITSAPLLHADGTVRVAEGYDSHTRLWCERAPKVVLPNHPSRDEAAAALLRLRNHFRTFAFADADRVAVTDAPEPVVDTRQPPGADESAFLVALLTAVCRPCLSLAPGLLIRAPQFSGAGTGKGLLVRALCAIAYGSRPVALAAGSTAEEFEKCIGTALMAAGSTVFIDNVNAKDLKSDTLASAITERPAAVRVLGFSKLVQLNPSAFVLVTGNGVVLSEDMARRFLMVELDAGVENPEARSFRSDFVAETMTARQTLLQDVLIIWRWGRQQSEALPMGLAMGSFPDWARWCRDPLLALGCQDPARRVAEAKARDPRRQAVAEMFMAWAAAHGEQPVTIADLHQSVWEAIGPQATTRQYVTPKVKSLVGTRAAGFQLQRYPSDGRWSADHYILHRTDPDSAASPEQDTSGEWSEAL